MTAFDKQPLRIFDVWKGRFAISALALATASCSFPLPARECDEDGDCLSGGVPGSCLMSPSSGANWCAFPVSASTCASGLQWGLRAGDDLTNTCVELADGGAAGMDGDIFDAAPSCTWTTPLIVLNVNSATFETGPTESPDGLALFFTRILNFKNNSDIFVATRSARTSSFGTPSPLSGFDTPLLFEGDPELSTSGLELFYYRAVPEYPGEIWTATRGTPSSGFGAPQSLGVNGIDPNISGDGLTLYFVDPAEGKVKAMTRAGIGGLWGPPQDVLATPYGSIDVSADELRLLLSDGPVGFSGAPVAIAQRPDKLSPFGTPVPLAAFNVVGDMGYEKEGSWSADERGIYVLMRLPGGEGVTDIYVSTCE
jgi:hypothetical protein